MRKWSVEEIAAIKQRHDAGETWQEIADSLGVKRESVRSVVRWTRKQASETQDAPPKDAPVSVNDAVSNERIRAHRQAEIAQLRRLTSRRAWIEEVRDAIKNTAITQEPIKFRGRQSASGDDEETAVLLIGDVHLGQNTDGRINSGWTQNAAVTEAQLQRLGDAVLRAWTVHQKMWRSLVILDLGDDVEGSNMRPSQARIVEPLVAQQSAMYGRLLARLIQRCLTVFEHVRVERVPGNHGRVSEKAGNAGMDIYGPENSWDWVAGEFVREILRHDIDAGRLTLINHDNWYATTRVAGKRVIFEHGSSERGGGIQSSSLTRMASAYRDLEGSYDFLALGHWHRPVIWPTGYNSLVVVNGAFPPTTPYVVQKHAATRPTQTLLSVHAQYGVTRIQHIFLDTPRDPRLDDEDLAENACAESDE